MEQTRCDVCHKLYDECRCSEYAENQRKRDHEIAVKESMIQPGTQVASMIKSLIIWGIVTGGISGIIIAIVNAIAGIM